MKSGRNEISRKLIYFKEHTEPWGTISDFILDENGRLVAYLIKTLSMIPLSKIILLKNVTQDKDNRYITEEKYVIEKKDYKNENELHCNNIKNVALSDGTFKKIKNIHFEMETGEMCDIVVRKNLVLGKTLLPVNKISLKDNTIYAENFIEEE